MGEKNLAQKHEGKKILFSPKHFLCQKIFVLKDVWYRKKCWSTKIEAQKFGPKSLVKIGSVTAEILLTLTNVARAYGAWTNISMTVGMCQKMVPGTYL